MKKIFKVCYVHGVDSIKSLNKLYEEGWQFCDSSAEHVSNDVDVRSRPLTGGVYYTLFKEVSI